VNHRILDKWLQDERWNGAFCRIRLDVDRRSQTVAKSELLKREIPFCENNLLCKRDQVTPVVPKRCVQQFGELFQRHGCASVLTICDERRDSVECVVQKMWMQLCSQRGEASSVQLYFKLRFTLRAPATFTRLLDAPRSEQSRAVERNE
jgi:hypothetical protein